MRIVTIVSTRLAAGLLLLSPALHAAPVAPPVRAEIDALLQTLATSGCQFNRNGRWYGADDAKAHLLRKLEYFENKDAVKTTEQFIDLAASTSSTSGKAYAVKCGDGAAVESRAWLTGQLKLLRTNRR